MIAVMRTAAESLDHLLIGAPTLESGIAWLEERTDVRALPGGSHPGLGTWNALASLGPRQYIEIIAPDPGQPGVDTFYVPGLRDLAEPRLATWAAKGVNLLSQFAATRPEDMVCEPARPGSRVRPEGTRLSWTLAFPRHRRHGDFDGTLPFLIDWESFEYHPGRSTPPGLTLRHISLQHPESERLNRALAFLGIEGAASPASTAGISVELATPRGPVVL